MQKDLLKACLFTNLYFIYLYILFLYTDDQPLFSLPFTLMGGVIFSLVGLAYDEIETPTRILKCFALAFTLANLGCIYILIR